MVGLFFTGPGGSVDPRVLDILLEKPKDQTHVMAEHLPDKDREWLTIESPVQWVN